MKRIFTSAYSALLCFALSFPLYTACSDDGPDDELSAPQLFATGATDPTRTTVTVSGRYSGHLSRIKTYGVKYSTSNNFPSDATTTVEFSSVPQGEVSTQLTGLSRKTHYYYCWYASTGVSTVQSAAAEFTTTATSKPLFNALTCDSIGEHALILRCQIADNGDDYLIERGISYRVKASNSNFISIATDSIDAKTNEFIVVLNDLTVATTYEVRPYAKNSADPEGDSGIMEGYGETQEFATEEQVSPEVAIYEPTNISATSAHLSGRIKSANGSNGVVDEFGLCYSTTNPEPTCQDDSLHFKGKTLNVTYGYDLTGLAENTTYYARFYAKNTVKGKVRYGYSDAVQFTTDSLHTPHLTLEITSVGLDSISCAATISANYDAMALTEKGFIWSTTSDRPELTAAEAAHTQLVVPGTEATFAGTLTGLTTAHKYYVRAYAIYKSAISTLIGYSDTQQPTTSDYAPATVVAPEVTDISFTSATLHGSIKADGNGTVSKRGFYVSSKTQTPTQTSHELDQTANDQFQAALTQLTAGTTYYVSAYAVYSWADGHEETQLSSVTTFKTEAYTAAVVAEPTVSDITFTSATLHGSVTSNGNGTITKRGFYISTTTQTPTQTSHELDLTADDLFQASLTQLTVSKTYYVRAYAVCSWEGHEETVLSTVTNFMTGAYSAAALAEPTVSDITLNSVVLHGSITSESNGTITKRGFYISSSTQTPTQADHEFELTADEKLQVALKQLAASRAYNSGLFAQASSVLTSTSGVSGLSADDNFQASLTQLAANKTYYVRAYAVCTWSDGHEETVLSSVTNFTTEAYTVAVLAEPTVSDITPSSAVLHGSITSEGTGTITKRGFYVSAGKWPTQASHEFDVTANDNFQAAVTQLTIGTTYYVRAYVVCSWADGHTETVLSYATTLETVSYTAAVLAEPTVSNITTSSAVLHGSITSNGNGTITKRGFYVSAGKWPTQASHEFDLTADDNFQASITQLTGDKIYYVRAYVVCSWADGHTETVLSYATTLETVSETVSYTVAVLAEPTVSDITTSSAVLHGSITSEGTGTITKRGFYVSAGKWPTQASHDFDVTADDNFQASVTQLTIGTTYYVRAYAVCKWSDGHEETVLSYATNLETAASHTAAVVSMASTSWQTDITYTSSVLHGTVTSEGNGAITKRGFYVSASTTPTLTEYDYLLTADENFQASITQLTPGGRYYARAYAVCSWADGYEETVLSTGTAWLWTPRLPRLIETLQGLSDRFIAIYQAVSRQTPNEPIITRGLLCQAYPGTKELTLDNYTYKVVMNDTTQGSSGKIEGLIPDTEYEIRSYVVTEMSGQQFLTYGDAAVWTTNHYNVASAWYEMSDNRTEIKYEINYYYGTFPNAEEIIGVGAWWSETQPSKVADIKQKQVAPFIRDTGNYLTYQTTITGLSADTNYYLGFYLIFSDGVVWYNIKDAKYTGDE